jgi:hypothetical protein
MAGVLSGDRVAGRAVAQREITQLVGPRIADERDFRFFWAYSSAISRLTITGP